MSRGAILGAKKPGFWVNTKKINHLCTAGAPVALCLERVFLVFEG